MKRRIAVLLAVLMLGSLTGPALAREASRAAMREKLTFAQGVLEGLVLQKFDLVLTNAARLRELNQTNAFTMLGNPAYGERRTNFFQSVDSLTQAAKEQDLTSATEAFKLITQSCVDCHKQFRREQFLKSQQEALKK